MKHHILFKKNSTDKVCSSADVEAEDVHSAIVDFLDANPFAIFVAMYNVDEVDSLDIDVQAFETAVAVDDVRNNVGLDNAASEFVKGTGGGPEDNV